MSAFFRSLPVQLTRTFARKQKAAAGPLKTKPVYEYDPVTAIRLMKAYSWRAFNESVDLCIKLGINPTRTEHGIRGTCVLPAGIGKSQRICFFGANAEEEALALKAGADLIGTDETIENIKKEKFDFDQIYSTTTGVAKLKSLARILGPKGLFPNAKVKTLFPPELIGEFIRRVDRRREERQSRLPLGLPWRHQSDDREGRLRRREDRSQLGVN